jgi:diguanylate cyclase (GGDEF)-like protein
MGGKIGLMNKVSTQEEKSSTAAPAWGKAGLLLGMLVVVVLVGWLDYAIGLNLRLYPLYIPPIAVAAWKAGTRAGVVVALASVAAWVVSHRLAGQDFSLGAWAFNSLAHMAAFATIIAFVSSLRRSHADEQRLARTDPLTGLANPRAFREKAEIELERQRRFQRPLTIAYIDLDNFKMVNDSFGHRAGDEVLAIVAQALRTSTRTTDFLGRLGGDEFAVLMPETDAQSAGLVLDRVQAVVGQAMAERGWPVSCSIGAVVFEEAPRDVDDLIGRADNVMYQVKQTSKNAIRIERVPGHGAG